MAVKIREHRGAWWLFIDHKGQRKAKRCGPGTAGKKTAELAAVELGTRLAKGDTSIFDDGPPTAVAPIPTLAEYVKRWLTTVAAFRLKTSSLNA